MVLLIASVMEVYGTILCLGSEMLNHWANVDTKSLVHTWVMALKGKVSSMQPTPRDESDQIARVTPRDACATCGMILLMPGVQRAALQYCCNGCVPRGGRPPGSLSRPDRGISLETARAVHIAADRATIASFVSKIELLRLYEQKLERLQVTATSNDGKRSCATADGHWALLPFHIELHFDALEAGGYKSTLCSGGPIVGLRGGFVIEPDGDAGCTVTHFENYEFAGGALGNRIARIVQPYIGWSMDRELRLLKRLIEDPALLADALRMFNPRQLAVDPDVPVWDPQRPHSARRGWLARVPSPALAALGVAFAAGALAAGPFWRRRRAVARRPGL